ncbi:hypothetical protein H0H92_013781 [Tricholoma furcatifolium]|nr:hypothetical protein H0H92_013781 [Tricholoma furcatifolium]
MTKKNRQARRSRRAAADPKGQASFPQENQRGGLLVTDELQKALEDCKSRVDEIAADCKRRNRKFRDIEFDLELDRNRCLHGLTDLSDPDFSQFNPSDVQRVTQIFSKPSFFIDGANANDIVQGALGDCWFVSALATMSTSGGLIEKFCVARDEQVGVYGFIFFRDTAWVTVIIDDLLFTSIPKFEELRSEEQRLYHNDKENYNRSARRTGKSLFFAKSGTHGETWVPLVEKAYAKLHGNYASIDGGFAGEAIEDMTGGITSFIYTKENVTTSIQDILDLDAFWTNELRRANEDRLFGCAFDNLNTARSGLSNVTVNGLFSGHAYSVLRAIEYRDKRFVVVRNPWGRGEWTGPWSDGSREWTPDWLPALSVLKHKFGDDGQFVMEYKDFIENWEQIERTLLFDSSWTMSSQWLKVTCRPLELDLPWAFGDVSFTISLPTSSSTVIVLSKLDERYYQPLSSFAQWSFDFIIYRKGENKPLVTSSPSMPYSRSVNAEVHLEAGEYVVHVRLNREINYTDSDYDGFDARTYARVRTEMAISQSIASNFDERDAEYIPISPDHFGGQDLSELEARMAELKPKNQESKVEVASQSAESKLDTSEVNSSTVSPGGPEKGKSEIEGKKGGNNDGPTASEGEGTEDEEDGKLEKGVGEGGGDDKDTGGVEEENKDNEDDGPEYSDEVTDVVFVGLRVYTNKAAPAKVAGQLRHTPLAVLTRTLGLGGNQKAT